MIQKPLPHLTAFRLWPTVSLCQWRLQSPFRQHLSPCLLLQRLPLPRQLLPQWPLPSLRNNRSLSPRNSRSLSLRNNRSLSLRNNRSLPLRNQFKSLQQPSLPGQ